MKEIYLIIKYGRNTKNNKSVWKNTKKEIYVSE